MRMKIQGEMPRLVQSFRQFSKTRRWLLRLGFDTKTTPFEALELCLLANLLGIEARDLGVASSGNSREEDERAIANSAMAMSVANRTQLQHRVREELAHRKSAFTAFCAMLSVLVAIAAAVSSHFSAKASSQSAATAQAAVSIIVENQYHPAQSP